MLRLGLLRALTSRAQTPILPMSDGLAVRMGSADGGLVSCLLDLPSGSLPAALVAVEPLRRLREVDTDRAGRGPLDGKAPSLLATRLLPLGGALQEDLLPGACSWVSGAVRLEDVDALVMGVVSVAVVGNPLVRPFGDLRELRMSSIIVPFARSLEPEAKEDSTGDRPRVAVLKEVTEVRLFPVSEIPSFDKPATEAVERCWD